MSLIPRAVTALLASALAVCMVAAGQPARAAASPASPAGHGATWLKGQLTRAGLVHNKQFNFDDYGLTADTALALVATGGHRPTVHHIRRAMAKHVDDYTTFDTDRFAGPIAKLLVVAQDTGGGARAFGGVNLIRRLAARVSATGPTRGRIEDRSSFGDNANTIGQIFAVRGLLKAGSPLAKPTLKFLLLQQCRRGSLRLDFTANKAAAKQGCTSRSTPDADVTALAVVELWKYRSGHSALRAALDHAVSWLAHHQAGNGSFGGGGPTSAPNTNSTGLAGWALGTAGRCTRAADAATWISKRQVTGDVSGTPLAGQRGAIAYNLTAMKAASKDGITVATRDQWRRATTQAAPALKYLSAGSCRSH